MRLLFDLGNTRVKWVMEASGQLTDRVGLMHEGLTEGVLDKEFSYSGVPSSVWLSSVGPSHIESIIEGWVRRRFNLAVNRAMVTKRACAINNKYTDLQQLGIDRWLAVLGARKFCPEGNVVVIDAGTAVTVDVLSADNAYLGGAILPGASLMHDSLVSRTEGIVSGLPDAVQLIGRRTQECVNSGVYYGLVGAVDRIVFQMCAELKIPKENVAIDMLITGGDAGLIMRSTTLEYRFVEDLVLHGLALVADGGS